MATFMNGHGWVLPEPLEGICITSAYEHNTPLPRVSMNYRIPVWSVLYIYNGRLWHSRSPREKTYLQPSRQALLNPPNTDRYEIPLSRDPLHAAYLLFRDSRCSHLNRLLRGPSEWVVFDDDDDATLGSLVRDCAAIGYRRGDRGFWDAQAILCRIVGLFLAARPLGENRYKVIVSGSPEEDFHGSLSQKADAYLHAQIDRILTLEDIARELGVSVSTLTHRYQKETGVPVMTAFTQRRIARIKQLLGRGYPVKLIARQMSFSQSSALSIFFKRHSGLSPREFLNRWKSSGRPEADPSGYPDVF